MHFDGRKSFSSHEYLLATLVYTVITLALFFPVATNPAQTVANYAGNPDLYQNLWNLWWVKYSLLTLHTSPYFTGMLFYPTGTDLTTQTMQPIAGILSIPLQYVSLVLAYNVVFLLGFILSGLSMYLLADHIVKNKYAASIAGLIFAFSPVHIAQSFTHLQWTSLEWMPLFILFFLKGIESKNNKHVYALGAAVFFLLTTFMGDIEQGVMVVIFAIVFLFFDIQLTDRRADYRNILLFMAETAGIVLIVGLPFIIPIAKSVLYANALGLASSTMSLSSGLQWSDTLLSFFVPSYFNSLLGGLAHSCQDLVYGYSSAWEGTSYLGYSVIFLSLAGVYYSYKHKEFLRTSVWMSIFFVFAALSLGPLVLMGKTYVFPGIYLLYYFIPVFNIIREPGRFDVVSGLCMAILSAYGLRYLLLEKNRKNEKNRNIMYTAIFAFAILVEYVGIPYVGPGVNALFYNSTATTIPRGYSYIKNSSQGGAVLLLPQNESALAMYYQTQFEKPILNGYVTRESYADYANAQSIPLVHSCMSYAGGGGSPGCDYPIVENYTRANMFLLPKYNVSFIVLMKTAYGNNDLPLMAESLNALARPVFSDNSTMIFEARNGTPEMNETVSYITGIWIAGRGAGGTSTGSDKDFWFVENESAIALYSPRSSNVSVAGVMTSLTNLTVTFYVNGEKAYGAKLEKGLEYDYAFYSQAQAGYNRIGFSTNASAKFVFGIRNTTIGSAPN